MCYMILTTQIKLRHKYMMVATSRLQGDLTTLPVNPSLVRVLERSRSMRATSGATSASPLAQPHADAPDPQNVQAMRDQMKSLSAKLTDASAKMEEIHSNMKVRRDFDEIKNIVTVVSCTYNAHNFFFFFYYPR